MDKKRRIIYDMFGGKCAYCGCDLPEKGFHVDHILPIDRQSYYHRNERKWKLTGKLGRPENECEDNKFPSCASCNIQKRDMSLEQFRKSISHFIISLNRDSTQYKIAKRYGLINENIKPIVFHFETFLDEESCEGCEYLDTNEDQYCFKYNHTLDKNKRLSICIKKKSFRSKSVKRKS